MTSLRPDLPWYDDSDPGADPGRGRPVLVLLHAFPLDSTTFDRVLPLLVDTVRVLRVDLPGLGRSVDQAVGEPSVVAMARAVLRVLDDAGVDRAAVHGVSTGGYVALALADLAPERVTALLLSSTTPWVGQPDLPADRLAVAGELERRGDTEPVADSVKGGLGESAQGEQPDLVGLVAGIIEAADPRGVAWVARALAARTDTSAVLAGFAGPVLLLYGAEDTEVPPGTVDEMVALRPAPLVTSVEVLPRTGHLLALERPAEAARALLAVAGEG
ncbi:alpha/beta fold hydrolase [Nocardioides sp. AX2bis]|uniref:alpha/beta fold hydrolase n=1 Tax=Nocardioides sp. AX2bis TaxID=2653157 RepID=UPI0012F42633|nr:alpha/beta hydrolase [Nocardioides sp. AX2bis]VXC09647.1 putative Carboxylesterase [Nocardioides sp. AX2bis]